MRTRFPIQLAFPVPDLEQARRYYVDINRVIEPTIRFKGTPGGQAALLFPDPSGKALELKEYSDLSALLAS